MRRDILLKISSVALTVSLLLNQYASYVTAEEAATSNSDNNKITTSLSNENLSLIRGLTLDEYKKKSALELAQLVREKKVTSKQLVKLAYLLIEENKDYNAVINTFKDLAIADAENLKDTGQPFLGVPLLLKGIGHTVKGGENTNGLITNKGKVLSRIDGRYAKDYKNLGFIVIGQTNYPELALRNITNSHIYGSAANSWNPLYNAGGSSGGSATAVGLGITPIASGSDAGGSIRIPASWNGLIGLKPSLGITHSTTIPKNGTVVHFPLTKTVADTIAIFDGIKNPKINPIEIPDIRNLTVGYSIMSPIGTEVSADAKKAVLDTVAFLREKGFIVVDVDNPIDGRSVMRDYTTLAIANGGLVGANFEKELAKQNLTKEDVDPLVWALYKANQLADRKKLLADVNKTWENIANYKTIMEKFHKDYPIFLTPTTATIAPLKDDMLTKEEDRLAMLNIENLSPEERVSLLNRQWEPMLVRTPFTQIANLTGEPAISLPTYVNSNNMPLGIMLNAGFGMDKVLLEFAKVFEDNNLLKVNKLITSTREANNDSVNVTPSDIVVKIPDNYPVVELIDATIGYIPNQPPKVDLPKAEVTIEEIPFEVIEEEDSTILKGERTVKTLGSNGTREIITVDGREVSNTVTKKPVNELVLIGTKVVTKVPETAPTVELPTLEEPVASEIPDEAPEVDLPDAEVTIEEIPFEVIEEEDSTILKGERAVKTVGSNGTREIIMVDGREVSNTVTKKPVNEVVLVGTKLISKVPETAPVVDLPAAEVRTEEIPFEVIEEEDATILKGKKTVKTAGENGTREIITVAGKEVSNTVIKSPVNEIVSVGTKVIKKAPGKLPSFEVREAPSKITSNDLPGITIESVINKKPESEGKIKYYVINSLLNYNNQIVSLENSSSSSDKEPIINNSASSAVISLGDNNLSLRKQLYTYLNNSIFNSLTQKITSKKLVSEIADKVTKFVEEDIIIEGDAFYDASVKGDISGNIKDKVTIVTVIPTEYDENKTFKTNNALADESNDTVIIIITGAIIMLGLTKCCLKRKANALKRGYIAEDNRDDSND